MDYKKTLNLTRTGFPMKGNLAAREPEIQRYWDEIGLYRRIMEAGAGRPYFMLHDGPPYANGDIHVGTAYNKIIKDTIIKYKTMRGYHCPYVPGWDCHGQPIEHEVTKRLGPEASIDKVELRRKCRNYALKFVERQKKQFERLGVLGDFEDPYLTLRPEYEATNIEAFSRLYRKGLIYRGRKPIYWCTNCRTALSEAEIEYYDKDSYSIFVKLPVVEGRDRFPAGEKPVSLLIWTTTPWTLPANVAVALSPKVEYEAVDTGHELLVMARDLVEQVCAETGVQPGSRAGGFTGSDLEGVLCRHPWADRNSRVVLADYVTLDQGTGCVHIAPGHGQEDYLTGLEYDLPSPMPVDDLGRFTEEAGPFEGMEINEANPEILKDLETRGLLLSTGRITHQYPHCWRCKQPVVFRATPQWFVALDEQSGGETLRSGALRSIEGVEWIPDWTVKRIGSMLESRPDWCISRQRAWGVPLPVLYCEDCGTDVVTDESLEAVRGLIEAEGADAWFRKEPEEFLPEGFRCPECGGSRFEKEDDILDVWFESGVSHLAVLKKRPELRWPADLYLEGSDQHRGWFQSSLLVAVGVVGEPPYRSVLTHGFTVDGEGKKMSKSLGNAIDPREVYNRSGADILRLWTVTTDYSSDMPISEEILGQCVEVYRRFRNTFRFLLGNTSDFDAVADAVPVEDMEEIDRWAVSRLQGLVERVTSLMDGWTYHQAIQALHLFCTVDLSSLYFDILKDRLYTSAADSRRRRSAQTALAHILEALTRMVAPVLVHTAEEVYGEFAEQMRGEPSVHLLGWPEPDRGLQDRRLEEKWSSLLEIREKVYRSIEEARQSGLIGTSLEARVRIAAEGETLRLLRAVEGQLPSVFIVSGVEVTGPESPAGPGSGEAGPGIEIERAPGEKCARCWNYSLSVGEHSDYPDICERCVGVMRTLET